MSREVIDGWMLGDGDGECGPRCYKMGAERLAYVGGEIVVWSNAFSGDSAIPLPVMRRFVEMCEAWEQLKSAIAQVEREVVHQKGAGK